MPVMGKDTPACEDIAGVYLAIRGFESEFILKILMFPYESPTITIC